MIGLTFVFYCVLLQLPQLSQGSTSPRARRPIPAPTSYTASGPSRRTTSALSVALALTKLTPLPLSRQHGETAGSMTAALQVWSTPDKANTPSSRPATRRDNRRHGGGTAGLGQSTARRWIQNSYHLSGAFPDHGLARSTNPAMINRWHHPSRNN